MEDMRNEIICGDAKEVLSEWGAECVDLVVTSPPYDNIRDYKGFTFDFEGIARQLQRILKLGGVIVWIVGDQTVNGSETGTSFKQALFFKEIGLNLHDTMIYNRGCVFPDANRYLGEFEYMFVLSKGPPKTVNFIMDRKNKYPPKTNESSYREKDGTMKKKIPKPAQEYGRRSNVWWVPAGYMVSSTDKMSFEHPATFPEALARDHIISWSNEGDFVLDPFVGSGTTGKMARRLNRAFVGIDISPEYCELAERRISAQEMPLFPTTTDLPN